jgi:3-methyladenine DNA glycosylase AlkD
MTLVGTERKAASRAPTVATVRARLRSLADARIAASSQSFFKTGRGDYGYGDRFLGIRVPALRKVAREFRSAPPTVAWTLLRSPFHEERLVALLMLVDRYARGTAAEQQRIYERYLEHVPQHVNNWDLVDSSAPYIVGAHVAQRDRGVLYELARSPHLWSRRVAKIVLDDRDDLIHKAAGWMLREVGNRDRAVAEAFLRRYCHRMPRTMLRYAIEKYPESVRRAYLAVKPGGRRRLHSFSTV